jgi:hypothetical protein
LSDFPEDDCLGGLTQLEYLSIGGGFSEEMEAFPAGVLNSIGDMWNFRLPSRNFPHQLQHLTALEELCILYFEGEEFEEALPEWLDNLSSITLYYILFLNI